MHQLADPAGGRKASDRPALTRCIRGDAGRLTLKDAGAGMGPWKHARERRAERRALKPFVKILKPDYFTAVPEARRHLDHARAANLAWGS